MLFPFCCTPNPKNGSNILGNGQVAFFALVLEAGKHPPVEAQAGGDECDFLDGLLHSSPLFWQIHLPKTMIVSQPHQQASRQAAPAGTAGSNPERKIPQFFFLNQTCSGCSGCSGAKPSLHVRVSMCIHTPPGTDGTLGTP